MNTLVALKQAKYRDSAVWLSGNTITIYKGNLTPVTLPLTDVDIKCLERKGIVSGSIRPIDEFIDAIEKCTLRKVINILADNP